MKVKVFKFNLDFASASAITKEVNNFCEEHNVVDIKINVCSDILVYTVIYMG